MSKSVADARNKLGQFLNSPSPNEIVFTRNATHSINQIAHGLSWQKGDVVLTTDREFQLKPRALAQLEQEQGIDHRVVNSHPDNTFDMEAFEAACADAGKNLRMVAMSHVGNLTALKSQLLTSRKLYTIMALVVDDAQSTPHMSVDVQAPRHRLPIVFHPQNVRTINGMGGLWGRYNCSTICGPSNPEDKP